MDQSSKTSERFKIKFSRLSFSFFISVFAFLSLNNSIHASDIRAKLNSANGSTQFQVRDSNDKVVGRVDSSGNALFIGSMTVLGGGGGLTSGSGNLDLRSPNDVHVKYGDTSGTLYVGQAGTVQIIVSSGISAAFGMSASSFTATSATSLNSFSGPIKVSSGISAAFGVIAASFTATDSASTSTFSGGVQVNGAGGISGGMTGGAVRISSSVYLGPGQTSRWVSDDSVNRAIYISSNVYSAGAYGGPYAPVTYFLLGLSTDGVSISYGGGVGGWLNNTSATDWQYSVFTTNINATDFSPIGKIQIKVYVHVTSDWEQDVRFTIRDNTASVFGSWNGALGAAGATSDRAVSTWMEGPWSDFSFNNGAHVFRLSCYTANSANWYHINKAFALVRPKL